MPFRESRAVLRRASRCERRGLGEGQPSASGRGAHLHLPKTPPPVREGEDICGACFLRTQAGRNREIRIPLVGDRAGRAAPANERWMRRFEVGFEGGLHLSG